MTATVIVDRLHQFYDMAMVSQWWSSEAFESYRLEQLSKIVYHAKKNVPFYLRRLDGLLKPDGDLDFRRWNDVPIIRRQDLVDHHFAMQSQAASVDDPVRMVFSSGSTGRPVHISVNRSAAVLGNGLRWRCQKWHGLEWSKNLGVWTLEVPPERPIATSGVRLGAWGPRWEPGVTGETWGFDKALDAPAITRSLKQRGCVYLNRNPKAALALALECERLDIEMPLDVILAQGEGVDETDRSLFQRVFGARVITTYSSKEGGQMAHPCEYGTLHVNEEAVFLEIVDDAGQPCPAGVPGRVLITPFHLTAQPLVRYELGDIAEFGAPCACGRHSLTLGRILGRATQTFRHPDGRALYRILPATTGKALLGCTQWQIAQVGPLDFEVRFVPASSESVADLEAFTQLFHQVYFPEATVTARPVRAIPRTTTGKYLEYVNEYAVSG